MVGSIFGFPGHFTATHTFPALPPSWTLWMALFMKIKKITSSNRWIIYILSVLYLAAASVPWSLCVWSQAWGLLAMSWEHLSLWSFCLLHNVTTGHEPKHSKVRHHPTRDTSGSICLQGQERGWITGGGGGDRGNNLNYCWEAVSVSKKKNNTLDPPDR